MKKINNLLNEKIHIKINIKSIKKTKLLNKNKNHNYITQAIFNEQLIKYF